MYELITSKFSKKFWGILLSLLLAVGMLGYGFGTNSAYAVDVGANPTPKVDIAVSLPSDYSGTFLDFKKELTEKLISEGMEPGSFRITDTATKIDTTNTEGWYVYDHYRSQPAYNALNLSSAQQLKQPFRQSDSIGGTEYTMEYAVKNNLFKASCLNVNQHIYADTDANGKTSMVFAGYPSSAFADYMIYPAPSDARRTFSFDINPAVIDTHTLDGYGFFINAGIRSGVVSGYAISFTNANSPSLQKINRSADSTGWGAAPGTTVQSIKSMEFGPKNTVRLTVELTKSYVTVQYQTYDANMNPGDPITILNHQALEDTGFNGFGPYVSYSSHGCNDLSMMRFVDLEMSYDSSAFDALKTTQYYEGAQQKYFINLAGDSNNPQIPDETDQTYADGINRMNENEIFYLSNAQDGKIVTDTVKDADGNITHQGLGSQNGYIAMSDDYVGEMARYIYTSFIEGKKFSSPGVSSPMPLANFYMVNTATGDQLMTIHQQHLVNTNETVSVNIYDKSKVGQAAGTGEDARIAQWRFRVLDPDNNEKANSGWVDSVSKIQDYVFDKNSKHGKWIFELTVKDQLDHESKASQTYITAFLDDQKPEITGANISKNKARFTFTDTGQGIDEDGITFLEDNRGSGVAAYWITNDKNAEPAEDDWIYFDEVQHSNYVDYDLDDTQAIIVWVKDECGNRGPETMFQPTHVRVEDPDGEPIEDYIVIGDKPIIVLPNDPEKPEDSDEEFSGWTTPDGDPVTPGTTPIPKDNEIIIRPSFAKDSAKLVYFANGGVIEEGKSATSAPFTVVSGSSILKKIEDQKIHPVREGYSFTGWKLISGQTNEEVEALVNETTGISTAPANKLIDPSDQVAALIRKDPNNTTAPTPLDNIKLNKYYLVAQWQIGKYKVNLDPNGGSNHGVNSFENIDYQYNVGSLTGFPLSGHKIPTKPGYIFQGWSVDKNNNTANMFKVAQGISVTPVAAPLMPSHDLTVYAVWKEDPDKFVVHFDSDGGSRHGDQGYKTATDTVYQSLPVAQKPGYTFNGWHFVNSDGSLGAQVNSGDTLKLKEEHTLKAQWTPRDDTKYTVDYYVNSGNKDASGNYIYTKVNSLDNETEPGKKNPTKTYAGTTEKTATVPDSDKLAELTTGGKTYWYNPESSHVATVDDVQTVVNNNVLSGTITGSPNLSLKLYYDRYFDVNVVKEGTGEGTVQSATKQKEGTTPTVSWKAKDGSHVARVIVDNVVRDDLINAGSYTVENPLENNVTVRVLFEKDSADQPGGDNPNPVNPPTPPVTDNTYFQINTSVEGTNNPQFLNLTASHSVKNKQDSKVVWNLDTQKAPYTIESITVDGVSQEVKNTGEVDFPEVTGNHNVVVKVKELASLGGIDVVTDDKYTVTVNRYGGDDKVTTSKTQLVSAGTDAKVTWSANKSDYEIAKVVVDGEAMVLSTQNHKTGNCNGYLKNIQANHVVDIYMVLPEKDDKGNPVEPEIPDYTNKDEFVTIATKLIGAEGDITGSITAGAIVKKDDSANYSVDWKLESSNAVEKDNITASLEYKDGYYYHKNDENNDNGYVCYELEKVMVNGQEVPKDQVLDANGTIKVATDANKTVEVVVKPVRHTVTITKYGQGDVSPTKSVYHLDDYTNLGATAAEGWILTKVDVDGANIFTYSFIDEAASAMQALVDKATGEAEKSAEAQKPQDESQDQATAPTDEAADNAVAPAEEPAEEATEAQAEAEATDQDAAETVEPQADVVLDEPKAANESTQLNLEPVSFLFNLFKFGTITEPAFAEGENNIGQGKLPDQNDIVTDHQIDVYFTQQAKDENGDPKVDTTDPDNPKPIAEPIPTTLYNVSGKIVAGEGSIDGNAKVKPGDSAKIKVMPAEGYEINTITDAEGNTYTPNENGEIELTNVNKNIELNVAFKRPSAKNNDPVKGNIDPVPQFKITATVQGGPGSIDGSGTVDQGTDRTVSWKAAEDTEKVAYVIVDGTALTGDELAQAIKDGSFTFDDVTKDHMITVVFDTNINNIDTDGDGKPDINKDDDGDGTPDTDVDTDGDGKPDVNKDTDGDGKPDVNIVDKDGDGKPDPVDPKKEDPENPTKPDTNIDLDDDGKPDVNKDTDGDGKPDINIVDKDGDGKPDPVDPKKEDPENPTKPDVNIDTNDDDIPDVNVDTDKDGYPDINIDKNDDLIPDLYIDVDGDYDPDVNIDTDKDGYPDVNVDINGDKTPDINIDTDNTGAWKPSSGGGNLDGIWKPDTNIDTGDGQGPIHTDYTDPIDYDHDGVHDLWKPLHDTNAENGYAYDTMKENWTKDNQPGEEPGDNGSNAGNTDNQDSTDKDSKDKKSKKSKSSKTGDMTAPIAGGIALIALLSGLVLVLARRRKEN